MGTFTMKSKNFCHRHDQEYMDHVLECPICVGERMKSIPAREIQKPKKFKRVNRNKEKA